MKNYQSSVICFGEIVWDIFPNGRTAGGAPMNVALNLHKLGIEVKIISRIGRDTEGEELRAFLAANGVDLSFIQQDQQYATGVIRIKLDEQKNATYDMVFPAAWDFIEYTPAIDSAIENANVVFGSLASRHESSYATLVKILQKAKLKIFDVNLRFPYYHQNLIETLLPMADIVKLNEEEVKTIGNWLGNEENDLDAVCKKLMSRYRLEQLILTLGEKGARVFYKDALYAHRGFKVAVVDTVGSGDAFLAALLAYQMKGKNMPESLEFACATGSYVVTQKGANPPFEENHIREFLSKQNAARDGPQE